MSPSDPISAGTEAVNAREHTSGTVLGSRQPLWVHEACELLASRRRRATGKPCHKGDIVGEAVHGLLIREGIGSSEDIPKL